MNDPTISPFFSGLLEREGHTYSNWGISRTTKPAVYVEPISYADVQTVVRDAARFPAPVSPVGYLLSVTSTVVNDGGTMLSTRKLDEILGLEHDPMKRHIVRVQAGCRLKKLNMWLQARGLEIRFQAEIGEASVGSVAHRRKNSPLRPATTPLCRRPPPLRLPHNLLVRSSVSPNA